MDNNFITVFDKEIHKRGVLKIQREETPDGQTVCHCMQYRGGGRYFSTEAECFAYAYGRGLIDKSENPWLYGGAKCVKHERKAD